MELLSFIEDTTTNSSSRTLTFQKNCFISFDENPLKMMKNTFCFILKAFLVLKIFKSLCRLFGHAEKMACLEI